MVMRFQEEPHMNFTYRLRATEERRRKVLGSSQQLLAAHAGRRKEEQCSQAAQVIGKCLLCLLVVAPPPLRGQESSPLPANADPASLALQGHPRPHPELSDGSTTFDDRADSSASVAAKSTINTNSAADYGQQTKRILYIMPNFHSVSAGSQLPPQSAKGKLLNATQDSFDYSSFVFVGALAGIALAQRSTPEFGHGSAGYGRYYWHSLVDQTDENYLVEGFMPILFRQDTRYYTLGRGGVLKRSFYAVSRAVITRTDAGESAANYSELIGAGAAAGLSNLYYPGRERTWTKTGQRWVLNVGLDVMAQTFKEFWPDVNHKLFKGN
jgi:hypothetical protein